MSNGHARYLGRKGGKARAAKLTPEQRQEIARHASEAARLKRESMTPEERSELARKAVAVRWENYRRRKARKP